MTKTKAKSNVYIKSVIVLTVICLVISAALAFANHVTLPIIEEGAALRAEAARKEVLPQEINGRRVLFPKGSTEFLFTSGEWAYYLEDVGKVSQARLYELFLPCLILYVHKRFPQRFYREIFLYLYRL